MADTAGFLIEVDDELLFGQTDSFLANPIDTPGFLLEEPEVLFGQTDVVTSQFLDSHGFLIEDPELLFGKTDLAPALRPTDSRGFLIDLDIKTGLPGDGSFEIGFLETIIPTISGSRMVEILYPTIHKDNVQKVLAKMDSEEWVVTPKVASPGATREAPVGFRVDTSYMKTFLDDLHSNRAAVFRLQTPGYTPFSGVNSQDNYVRFVDHGRPQRDESGLLQTIEVTFLFVATF